MSALKHGVPTLREYIQYVSSKDFKDIESFSDDFIDKVGAQISSYNTKWVKDPFHQWSRQWEYPYVIKQIARHRGKNKDYRALDLGSGVTFLPYYLKNKVGVSEVVALDYDKSLGELFDSVNAELEESIQFHYHDMRKLNTFAQGTFDAVYSVSVLEHTNEYRKIIKDSYKLLKPGGIFVLTFDISLDGIDDIPLDTAKDLVDALEKTYKTTIDLDLDALSSDSDIVVSKKIAQMDKKLMPWKYPIINVFKPALKQQRFGTRYKNLTACCVTLQKPKAAKK